MSYDLFFRAPSGRAAPSPAEILGHFAGRPNYSVSEKQAVYANEDTGVYFTFDLAEGGDGGEAPGGWSFNLNYVRPHVFALEAEPEVAAFVRAFGLEISDPQVDGMDEGPYTTEGFLRGWNAGNRFAVGALVAQGALDGTTDHLTMPEAEIERVWRWNAGRAALQRALGEGVFVPVIMSFRRDGQARTLAVWGDGIPIALPRVDFVAAARHELAPRKWLLRRRDVGLVPFADLQPVLATGRMEEAPLPHYLLAYTERPALVTEFFRQVTPLKGTLDGVPFDRILDAEVVEAARANPPRVQTLSPS